MPLSRTWFADNLGQHVEGFHLEDDAGQVIGHIYWAPSDKALVPYRIEDRVAFIYCEWVQRQHRGRGGLRMLFDAFVDFLRADGYKGILVDGTDYEDCMHQRHFARRGFRVIRDTGAGRLMYLPLSQESVQVEPLSSRITREGTAPVEVRIIGSRFCPVGASAVLALRKAASEFGDRVTVKEMPAGADALDRYGVADGIFINGQVRFFGPVTEEQVRQAIREAIASV
ncbi:MAG TPA: GNAT family N-acetyltransferase [Anaerolineae bacterium]|nr:GNAT family N-acetyltransferase [Anaerolineae bacterium]